MKLIKEKKGAEKVMSVYWFVILFLVAGAIVYMVSIFYGSPYDVREIESNVLINNVANCLSKNQELILIDDVFRNNFLEVCHLNLNTEDEEIQYYIEVEFLDFNGEENIGENEAFKEKVIVGNLNLNNNPNIGSVFESEKSFYVLKGKNEDFPNELEVKIFTVISKTKENVG